MRKSSKVRNLDSNLSNFDEDCKENSTVQNEKTKLSSNKLKEKEIIEAE